MKKLPPINREASDWWRQHQTDVQGVFRYECPCGNWLEIKPPGLVHEVKQYLCAVCGSLMMQLFIPKKKVSNYDSERRRQL